MAPSLPSPALLACIPVAERPFVAYTSRSSIPQCMRQECLLRLLEEQLVAAVQELKVPQAMAVKVLREVVPLRQLCCSRVLDLERRTFLSVFSKKDYIAAASKVKATMEGVPKEQWEAISMQCKSAMEKLGKVARAPRGAMTAARSMVKQGGSAPNTSAQVIGPRAGVDGPLKTQARGDKAGAGPPRKRLRKDVSSPHTRPREATSTALIDPASLLSTLLSAPCLPIRLPPPPDIPDGCHEVVRPGIPAELVATPSPQSNLTAEQGPTSNVHNERKWLLDNREVDALFESGSDDEDAGDTKAPGSSPGQRVESSGGPICPAIPEDVLALFGMEQDEVDELWGDEVLEDGPVVESRTLVAGCRSQGRPTVSVGDPDLSSFPAMVQDRDVAFNRGEGDGVGPDPGGGGGVGPDPGGGGGVGPDPGGGGGVGPDSGGGGGAGSDPGGGGGVGPDPGGGGGVGSDPGGGEGVGPDSGGGGGAGSDPGGGGGVASDPGGGGGVGPDPGGGEGVASDPGGGEGVASDPGGGEGVASDPGGGGGVGSDPGGGGGVGSDPGGGEGVASDPGGGEGVASDPGGGDGVVAVSVLCFFGERCPAVASGPVLDNGDFSVEAEGGGTRRPQTEEMEGFKKVRGVQQGQGGAITQFTSTEILGGQVGDQSRVYQDMGGAHTKTGTQREECAEGQEGHEMREPHDRPQYEQNVKTQVRAQERETRVGPQDQLEVKTEMGELHEGQQDQERVDMLLEHFGGELDQQNGSAPPGRDTGEPSGAQVNSRKGELCTGSHGEMNATDGVRTDGANPYRGAQDQKEDGVEQYLSRSPKVTSPGVATKEEGLLVPSSCEQVDVPSAAGDNGDEVCGPLPGTSLRVMGEQGQQGSSREGPSFPAGEKTVEVPAQGEEAPGNKARAGRGREGRSHSRKHLERADARCRHGESRGEAPRGPPKATHYAEAPPVSQHRTAGQLPGGGQQVDGGHNVAHQVLKSVKAVLGPLYRDQVISRGEYKLVAQLAVERIMKEKGPRGTDARFLCHEHERVTQVVMLLIEKYAHKGALRTNRSGKHKEAIQPPLEEEEAESEVGEN